MEGWDDPRMPTLAGLRRRGCPSNALRSFIDRIGVTKSDSRVEMAVLEGCIREELDAVAPRRMAVLNPLKVVIENFPEGETEWLDAANHPKDESFGSRRIPLTREIWIDRADFLEQAPNKFKRLVLDGEVRLRNGYVIRADRAIKDEAGEITELRCSYDPETLGQNPEGRKVRGVIHWVSASHGVEASVRLYDRLFAVADPGSRKEDDWLSQLNPESLVALERCVVEPDLSGREAGERFQFEREGYFCVDTESTEERPVFNRTVTLRDTWAKIAGGGRR